ncbi:flagellar basal-body rod protein FlgF [Telmatospirillum siberiense]|uniref:Flagellar basal-body rod protein FlgF n=1 Tax=Telmatospirillum siberiense TaxID=382514 RepID=A0A2N3Q052_9PROT|nr:flagellar basal-body rod protein FlgF [Telmatospirillum siberiense]PKU26012.1 flagellar basal-body rod protein FlgF [Telmatospirillum siberiense]
MENTSYVALSRQAALWRQMEVVANNLANANTPSYKTQQVMFSDYVVKSKTDTTPFGQKVSFVRDQGMLRDTREGPVTQTGAPLDVSIHGDGYFTIDTPAGQRYTREGHFRLDENGMVVTASGYPVLQQSDTPIVLAPNEAEISIAGDGTLSSENGVIGKMKVVTFDNDQQLRAAGDGTYQTTQTPNLADSPNVSQGMLEESNVQPVAEMTNMMTIMRNYESIQNLIDNENSRQLKAMSVLSQSQQNA